MQLSPAMRQKSLYRERGFSVIELMIVVAIILILVAMVTPHVLRARRAAQHASAYASLREISVAEELYNFTYAQGYAPLRRLGGASPCRASAKTACLLDETLAEGRKDGYTFFVQVPETTSPAMAYEVFAIPDAPETPSLAICADRSGSPGPCRSTPPSVASTTRPQPE